MKLKELLEKRASLFEEVQALAKRNDLSEEEVADFNAKADELETIDKSITTEQRKAKIASMTAKAIETDARESGTSKEDMAKQYEMAFRGYIMGQLDDEKKDILKRANVQNTTAATGGYTIPTGFSGVIEKAMLYFLPFNESLVTIWKTESGNPVAYPSVNDTTNLAYQLAEGGNATTSAEAVTFGSTTFNAYKFTTGMLQVSFELLQDSFFNLEQVIGDIFGERMARGLSLAFTTGTGSGQPQGVVTGSAAGATAATATAITRADILNLLHSVDPEYRKNGTWMFNDSTLKAIRSLAFGTGDDRPLYQVSPIAGQPDLIEGYPYVVNNNMDAIGASKKSILFGDFKRFTVRFAGADRMKVSYERFADTDEVGMAMFKRVDSKLMTSAAIKRLTHPSS